MKIDRLTFPQTVVIVHTVLILASMVALWNRWLLTPLPYDCIYVPFLVISGPFVYFVAHYLQHVSEAFLRPEQVMIAWNVVPGVVCIILGGIQWYFAASFLAAIFRRRKTSPGE